MPERNAAERGIVLVLVLWAITVLAVIAGTFSAGARTQMGLAHNAVANAEAEALADAGIYRAIDGLLNAPEETAPRTDGTVYAWSFGGGDVRYSVTDENGKIDLNLAAPDLLARLFEAAGEAPDASRAIAAAVVDYRDGDDEPSPGGAEDRDYADAGFGEAKDAPFEMIEELTNVIGMTPTLYRRIAPYVTVYADDGVPDASVAPPLVRLILERLEAPEAMQDDAGNEVGFGRSPFDPRQVVQVDEIEHEDGGGGISGASVYEFRSEARTVGGAVFARTAIVRLSGGGSTSYRIHRWNQAARRHFAVAGK